MLLTLNIQNIALIKELEVDFSQGLTALTGQTGAGKSILIDSIGLLTGTKADKSFIRTGEESASVWGIFGDLSPAATEALALAEIAPDGEGHLLIERHITSDGKGKIKANGRPITLTALKEISKYLIDIHGQNDTLALYDSATYIQILDEYARLADKREEYARHYADYLGLRAQIDEISRSEQERVRTIEMLTYQLADIDALHLKSGEDEVLEEQEKRIKNHERIYKQADFAYRALKGAEKGNATMLLDRSAQALEGLADVVPEAEEWAKELRECMWRLEDIAERACDLAQQDDGDPTALIDKIESRLAAIAKLKKKYGSSVEEILAYREEIVARLERMQNADERLAQLKDELGEVTQRAVTVARELHAERIRAGEALAEQVIKTLVFLDMPKVTFSVSVLESRNEAGEYVLDARGFDTVDFLISANEGEQMHSLARVASGGELARMMLALKCVERSEDGSKAMIFDEIDTGVSGKTARKIGMKLLELSRTSQIFCVTHSAQIASLADVHYLIAKHEAEGRTVTTLSKLDRDGRIDELSRILGGIQVTEAQRRAALDMLSEKSELP